MASKTQEKASKSDPLKEEEVNPSARYCTDCPCCLGWLLAVGSLIYLHVDCFNKASPWRVTHPLDHDGNSCGLGDMKDYPKVYYPAKHMIFAGALSQDVYYANPTNLWGVCTKTCPDGGVRRTDRPGMCAEGNNTCTWYSELAPELYLGQYCILAPDIMKKEPTIAGTVCNTAHEQIKNVQDTAYQSLDNIENATQYYLDYVKNYGGLQSDADVQQALGNLKAATTDRVMILKQAIQNVAANTTEENVVKVCDDEVGHQKSYLTDFLREILAGWAVLITCICISLVVGGLYLLIVCFFAKHIIWGSLFVFTIGFLVAGILFWDDSIQVADTGLVESATEEKILAVICWICCFLGLLLIVVWRKSLKLAIAISSSTSSFLLDNLGIMIMPQILCILKLAFFAYWLVGLAGILSTAEVLPADNLTEEYNRFKISTTIVFKMMFHIGIGLWVYGYIEGLGAIATSITVTAWFYKPKVDGEKPSSHLTCFAALFKAFRYHSGSAAVGSLLTTVTPIVRSIVHVYSYLTGKLPGKTVQKLALAVCKCCLWFVEAVAQYIAVTAFIMVGITGKNFCKSAWGGFCLQARNPSRFLVFSGVMWTVNVVGRLFICFFVVLWGALLLNKSIFPSLSKHVHSPWPVLLAVFVIAYLLSGLIFGVYTHAGTALFYCFVADEEANKTSGRDATTYAPSAMVSLLNNSRKLKEVEENDEEDIEENSKGEDEQVEEAETKDF